MITFILLLTDYKRLNEQEESVPLPQGPVSSPWRLQDNDKKEIGFQIKDIVSIDSLNDCFLSKFFYSLMEHDEVCDCLHRDDLGSGVLKLFATMETCPMEIMHCFCDTLDMIGKERIVTQWKLRDKYHCSEIKQPG